MAQSAPKDFRTCTESVGKWQIRIKSYQLADEYVCSVDNVDPGAVIAYATAATREEAERKAVASAKTAMGVKG